MSNAIIVNSPLAIRRERPNTSLSEDESGPLALSEPTGGNMVRDDVLVGVIMVIGVALATGVVGVVGAVGVADVVGVGVMLPTVRVVWARNAPVAMSLAVTVTCEASTVTGKWKFPLIFPFLSDTTGVSNKGKSVVPSSSMRFIWVPPGNQLLPTKAIVSPP